MASLGAAAEVQRSAPVRRKPPRPASAPRTRAKARRQLSSGVMWIAVFGVLLAGIVAINVAVLQSNIQLDKLGQQRAKLRAENAALGSQVSAAAAGPNIQSLAARRLGLVQAAAQDTTYVQLNSGSR
jgi:cell division protein FtsB